MENNNNDAKNSLKNNKSNKKNKNKKAVEQKNKKLIKSLVATIILLVIFSGVSVAYNFLGGFYYCRVISFDKVLGEEQTINIDGVGAYVCACNFSGSLVVGSDVKQIIYVKTLELETPIYLRAKCVLNGIDYDGGKMFGFSNWINAEDGYIYFNQAVNSNQKIGMCNTIKIDIQMEIKSSTNYIVMFIVESSKTNWDYVAV